MVPPLLLFVADEQVVERVRYGAGGQRGGVTDSDGAAQGAGGPDTGQQPSQGGVVLARRRREEGGGAFPYAGVDGLACSSQSKARASEPTVPESRAAVTTSPASLRADRSRMVSRHHGSPTPPVSTVVSARGALGWAAARYSCRLRWANPWAWCSRSTSRPLLRASSRKTSGATSWGSWRSGRRIAATALRAGQSRALAFIMARARCWTTCCLCGPLRPVASRSPRASERRWSRTSHISAYNSARLPGSFPR
ncbi:hypothetical protein [Streptomyces sp. IBSBF 2435]|uniref:hypothetical protein n=1 Tax=Streptomyces sp. IBSBF 2435 TaxID=2903531 RepID=UPI002FDC60C2